MAGLQAGNYVPQGVDALYCHSPWYRVPPPDVSADVVPLCGALVMHTDVLIGLPRVSWPWAYLVLAGDHVSGFPGIVEPPVQSLYALHRTVDQVPSTRVLRRSVVMYTH